MVTKLSTKGQVVLPGPLRRRLGLRPGDSLDASLEGGRIVLTPRKKMPAFEAKIIEDPLTGFPVISLGPDAPILTSKEVEDALEDFP
jgi:AbrB family looped-hinge helix DNA binding protein